VLYKIALTSKARWHYEQNPRSKALCKARVIHVAGRETLLDSFRAGRKAIDVKFDARLGKLVLVYEQNGK
jgi:hypothetical protein